MPVQATIKKPANLTLDQALLQEARAFGINISQAAEAGLRRAVNEARAEAWQRENAEALASSNTWVEGHGLPLARFQQF